MYLKDKQTGERVFLTGACTTSKFDPSVVVRYSTAKREGGVVVDLSHRDVYIHSLAELCEKYEDWDDDADTDTL